MCDSTGRYEVTGGALPALGGPQSLFIIAQDAVPAGRRWRKTWGKATASLRTVIEIQNYFLPQFQKKNNASGKAKMVN